MKNTLASLLVLLAIATSAQQADKDGWIKLFDGQTLNNWHASEHPATFTVKDGSIVVDGERAHLFYEGPVGNHNFTTFEFKVTVMTLAGSNSGIFIHTGYQETGWPSKGYEVQVNQTHTDWRKTGSVYAIQDVKEVFVKDGEWYTEHIIVQGRKVTVKVNDKIINEYTETTESRLTGGTVALQGHDPKSKVYYKDVMIRILP
jgi:opacity protein-like surface antigen